MIVMPLTNIEKIRLLLSDIASKNEITDFTVEFADDMIQAAIDLTVHDFNYKPPLRTFLTADELMNFWEFQLGVASRVLYMKVAELERNRLVFADSGITVDLNRRSDAYRAMADLYASYYENWANRYKLHLNYSTYNYYGV